MNPDEIFPPLDAAARHARRYLESLEDRRVFPALEQVRALDELNGPLPDDPEESASVIERLDRIASPATVATAGGRYFGFVTGGSLPAALAASWLAGAWDQNGAMRVSSPAGAAIEEVALRWVREALGLPETCSGGFVTAATTANLTALAAARRAVLAQTGWDPDARGLFGAPEIQVIVGEEVHASVLKALGILGLGRERIVRVPADDQGRMRADAMPEITPPAIVCTQAGNVNSGAFDPIEEIAERVRPAGAWVHVDGAFGLWALASPKYESLAAGSRAGDSWALDAHKWLNVPYDSGIVLCRDAEAHRGAMALEASYLVMGAAREPCQFVPELSRRIRGVEIWAALRSLGRRGLADLVERCCRHALRFAEVLRDAGHTIHNEIVLNQVVVSFGDAERTRRVIEVVQNDGTCWAGGTHWQGRTAMRISVSSWATTEDDVERSLEAILRAARSVEAGRA